MKKLLLITSVLTLAALSSMAQGYINANNNGTGVSALIQNPLIDGGTAVKIGTPATAAGFVGAGPAQVAFTLYALPDSIAGGSIATLLSQGTSLATGFNVVSGLGTQQGNFAPGSSIVLPSSYAAFAGSAPVDFLLYATVTVNGVLYTSGLTGEGAITPTSAASVGTGTLPITIFGGTGIQSLVLTPVPEPSTIVLGGLGAAALLAFRRRK
jgi:hypothetical protein